MHHIIKLIFENSPAPTHNMFRTAIRGLYPGENITLLSTCPHKPLFTVRPNSVMDVVLPPPPPSVDDSEFALLPPRGVKQLYVTSCGRVFKLICNGSNSIQQCIGNIARHVTDEDLEMLSSLVRTENPESEVLRYLVNNL